MLHRFTSVPVGVDAVVDDLMGKVTPDGGNKGIIGIRTTIDLGSSVRTASFIRDARVSSSP
jgi:hypothetical protein